MCQFWGSELAGAVLCADGPVRDLVGLSLAAEHWPPARWARTRLVLKNLVSAPDRTGDDGRR